MQASVDPVTKRRLCAQISHDSLERDNERLRRQTFYGIYIETIINRILGQYVAAKNNDIARGRGYLDWTREKLETIGFLQKMVNEIVKIPADGEEVMTTLYTDIQGRFMEEYLPQKRKTFNDKKHWLPGPGTLETDYVPMILKSIDLVYRVFKLFQIENKTRADQIEFLLLAHDTAIGVCERILKNLSKDVLLQAEDLLGKIEAACPEQEKSTETATEIDRERLRNTIGTCAQILNNEEKLAFEQASQNSLIAFKTMVNQTVQTGEEMLNSAGNLGDYLFNKFVNLYVSQTVGEQAEKSDGLELECQTDEDDYVNVSIQNGHKIY